MQRERNRKRDLIGKQAAIAKRYGSTGENGTISGYYNLVPADGDLIAERYALLVKLDVVSGNYINGP